MLEIGNWKLEIGIQVERICVLILLAMLASGCATISQQDLTAPRQIAPADGTVFNTYPRETTLEWEPVPGAVRYGLMVDIGHGDWWSLEKRGKYLFKKQHLAEPRYTFNFPGAQKGRWRVWACDADGSEGPKSPWWTFEYKK